MIRVGMGTGVKCITPYSLFNGTDKMRGEGMKDWYHPTRYRGHVAQHDGSSPLPPGSGDLSPLHGHNTRR